MGSREDNMFRWLYRVGLLLGAAILALFIGARLIHLSDPYRIVTEELVRQIAAEPQRTVRLNEYGTLAVDLRRTLHTEEAAVLAYWLDDTEAVTLAEIAPVGRSVKLVVGGVDTAVHKIAAFDSDLEIIAEAESLSRDLARLRFYDMDQGEAVLASLYGQSTAVSYSLAKVSEGVEDVATAVSAVTTLPGLEMIQQEIRQWRDSFTNVASNGGIFGQGADLANEVAQLANFVYLSIESWQGVPASMWATKQRLDGDVVWLDGFEQQYRTAKAFNDRWHFDTLRQLPRFVAAYYQPLLMGIIGSLLLAIGGWIGHFRSVVARQRQSLRAFGSQTKPPVSPKPSPRLAFCWPDGRRECQPLPSIGELAIGNIVIRRARVRYYLERIDNAFPAFLNGQTIGQAHILNEGDVLQIGELQTIFQLAA